PSEPSLSKSVIRPVGSDVSVQNSFVRKAFSLPRPLESPNDILLALKQVGTMKHQDKSAKPLPAHSSSAVHLNSCVRPNVLSGDMKHGDNEMESLKSCKTPRLEILDLSVKKRCIEADSRTSPSVDVSNNASGDTAN